MVIFRQREDILREELGLSRIEDAQLGGQVENLWCNRSSSYYPSSIIETGEGEGSERYLKLHSDVLVGEGLGHFSEDIGGDFWDPMSVLPQKPEDGRSCGRNGYLVNHLCDMGDQVLVV